MYLLLELQLLNQKDHHRQYTQLLLLSLLFLHLALVLGTIGPLVLVHEGTEAIELDEGGKVDVGREGDGRLLRGRGGGLGIRGRKAEPERLGAGQKLLGGRLVHGGFRGEDYVALGAFFSGQDRQHGVQVLGGEDETVLHRGVVAIQQVQLGFQLLNLGLSGLLDGEAGADGPLLGIGGTLGKEEFHVAGGAVFLESIPDHLYFIGRKDFFVRFFLLASRKKKQGGACPHEYFFHKNMVLLNYWIDKHTKKSIFTVKRKINPLSH